MEEVRANSLAKDLKISPVRVVQENYEMIILKYLAESEIGRFLVFKGGTALRLIYGAPRFSEDLDFSLTQEFTEGDFKKAVREIAEKEANLEVNDIRKKRWTYFALVKIREDFLAQPLSIKIEVSARKKVEEFETKIARSKTSPLEVLIKVLPLEKTLEEKMEAFKERQAPKDLFDIWYISGRLEKEVEWPEIEISEKRLEAELHKFLPRDFWSVTKKLTNLISKKSA